MRTFTEFNLLTNKDAERLLAIMNIFLAKSETLNYKLETDEVYKALNDRYKWSYDEKDLEKDLKYLCKNNNLSCQDENPFGIQTLQEYKNRRKYYSITSSGIAFTRAIGEYLKSAYKQKILSQEYFDRIERDLQKLNNIDEKDIYEWWEFFVNDCTVLFQSYQDYINQFNSEEFNKLYDKVDFLNYKNDFIVSLNQMISNLGENARRVSEKINANFSTLKKIVKKICDDKNEIQISILLNDGNNYLIEETLIRWDNIRNWFMYEDGQQPVYLSILEYTSSIIGRIMNRTNVLSILEINRKKNEELSANISLFHDCISLDEAASLYAKKFGVQNILHLGSNHQDSNLCEDYETGTVLKFSYEKLSRSRRKTMEIGFKENSLQRERVALEIMKKQREMETHLLSFIKDDKLNLSNITEEISQKETEILLRWVSSGMSGKGQTDDGLSYSMIEGDKEICLKTESGDLYIKDYILDFGEKQ